MCVRVYVAMNIEKDWKQKGVMSKMWFNCRHTQEQIKMF